MATRTSLKKTPALSNYLRHAPIASIHQLCDMAATKDRLPELATLDWPKLLDERCRGRISRAIAALPQEVQDRLNDYANQILDLSRNDAAASMDMAEEQAYQHNPEGIALLEVLNDQPDAIGRATALLALAPKLFDITQRHFYSYYYRGGTQNYRNFEITPNGQAPEVHWNDEICQKLEPALQACLGLAMPCRVEHLEIERRGEDDEITLEHHFVIRHAGEKSSVTHIVDEDLNTEPLYYQPPIEAVVIVLPTANRVEVFNRDKALSVDLASVVVSIVVSSALSERPVSLRQYNLSRFYESLTLPQDVLNDLSGVERAVVTEVEFQPDNHKRRLNIKVGSDDDIEEALDDMLGVDSPLRTGQYTIAKVLINMVVSLENKNRTINVYIRTPNNSNLAGLKDPTHRALATEVFKRYGLLEDINPPAHNQLDQALFDALLRLYESGDQRVYLSKLRDWGVSEQPLLERGFLTTSTPASTVPITDPDGNVTLVKVQGVGQNLFVTDPITKERRQIYPEQTVRYAIDHNWVLETLRKSLASALKPYPSSQPEDTALIVGQLEIGSQQVPVYLVPKLRDSRQRRLAYNFVRAQGKSAFGLVLTASQTYDEYLGGNVVIALRDVLTAKDDQVLIDAELIEQMWQQRSNQATSTTQVHLERTPDDPDAHATLYVPGKEPWPIAGKAAVTVVDRLVKAYNSRSPVMQSSNLLVGLNVSARSLVQLFSKSSPWRDYIGHPPGKSRGWTLLTDNSKDET